nr:peptidase domain-containing ABC transporter [Pleionea sediminis]
MQLFGLSLLLQTFAMIAPFYTQLVVDDVVVSQDMDLLVILAIGFGMLVLFETLTKALRSLVLLLMGSQISLQIGANLFRHLLRLPIDYFQKRHVGDIVSRFTSLEEVKKLLTSGVVEAIVDGVMVIGTLIMMLVYNSTLSFIVITVVIIYTIIRMLLFPMMRQRTEETIVAHAKQDTNTIESIRAVQSIKIFGAENHRQTLWQNRYADSINSSIRLGKLNISFETVNNLLFGLKNVLVIYFSALAIVDNVFSVGMLFAFIAYKRQFTGKAVSFIEKMIQYRMLGLHLQRLGDIALSKQEDLLEQNTESTTHSVKGKIELKNVGFRYSDNEPFLFRNLSMIVEPGESVALTGPSGVGKSTLLKIILGLMEPTEGEIFIDDRPVSKWDKRFLRNQYGTVMHDDTLLSGSFAENISFFSETPNHEEIERCAEISGFLEDIKSMPMGFNTLIGDMGTTLSGGQQQRLLLARALYRKPKMLLLDEATSHLDEKLEKLISHNIKKMNITRLFIAHRSETIKSADRVVTLKKYEI